MKKRKRDRENGQLWLAIITTLTPIIVAMLDLIKPILEKHIG